MVVFVVEAIQALLCSCNQIVLGFMEAKKYSCKKQSRGGYRICYMDTPVGHKLIANWNNGLINIFSIDVL